MKPGLHDDLVTRNFRNYSVNARASERCSAMTTYVYETIPQSPGEVPVRFEVKQEMNAPKLTEQPGTGKPVRRLISGGFTLLRGEMPSAGSVTDSSWHCKD